MTQASTVRDLGIALVVAMVGSNAATAAYQALLPDLVPRSSWGAASGVRGVATLVGTVIGLAIAGASDANVAFLATAVALVAGAATLFAVHERPHEHVEEHAKVRDWHDFVVVFVGRAFVVFGLDAVDDVRAVFLPRRAA